MRRNDLSLASTLRTMVAVTAIFLGVTTAIHMIGDGVATQAIASSEGIRIGDTLRHGSGAGLVIFVGLQRS